MKPYTSFIRRGLALAAFVFGTIIVHGADPAGSAARMNREDAVESDPWRHQVYQNDIDLDSTKNYLLTFWVRADLPTQLSVATKNNTPPWSFFGLRTDVYVSTTWKRHRLPFSATGAIPGQTRLTFNFKDKDAAQIWVADVAVQLAGAEGEGSFNLVKNPRFENGLESWSHEGAQLGLYSADVQTMAEVEAAVQGANR